MARPVNADAKKTRRRILDVAGGLVSSHGIEGTSIRHIAREAGVSLATVHHYFGSKEELHAACIEEMYRELWTLKETLAPALFDPEGGSFASAVEEVVRRSFQFALEHRSAQRLVMRLVVERGIDPDRVKNLLEPFLSQGSQILSTLSGRPTAELRFAIQSLVFLSMRYSIAFDHELCAIAQTKSAQTARKRAEDHLVGVALALLGLESEVRKRSTGRPGAPRRRKKRSPR